MSAVDYEAYYYSVYMGSEADAASFPALCARAVDVIGAMTHWVDITTYPQQIQDLYAKAVCAQIDFFAVNGLDSVAGGSDRGFTVGKVHVNGRAGDVLVRKGSMADNISPMAIMYLEQTGLLNPSVPVAPAEPLIGWWF